MTTYYGFSKANTIDEPAWFHTPEAAGRFATACGWENAEVETTDEADPGDIMDTPEKPWNASAATTAQKRFTIELTEEQCHTIGYALLKLSGANKAEIDAQMRSRAKDARRELENAKEVVA